MSYARRSGGDLAIWPSRVAGDIETKAAAAGVSLVRVEDGFLRSRGLGATCHLPLSLIFDRKGLHFDPDRPSELEEMLSSAHFTPGLIDRARRLTDDIVGGRLTKYNLGGDRHRWRPENKRTVLVVGQVEDDLSFRLAGAGIETNLALLRQARGSEPDSHIIYKPHPDVEAGLRRGDHSVTTVLRHADAIAGNADLPTLFEQVDAVHVLSSLAGFEALLREKNVVVHGKPFYAGWGLTQDLAPLPRRGRRLALAELVGAALILYPRYIDPATMTQCSAEHAVAILSRGVLPAGGPITWIRAAQGRLQRKFSLGGIRHHVA